MFDGAGFSFPSGYPLADDWCGLIDSEFCNGKLIAARHFRTIPLHPDEFDSPLGANGHGTHVAGTAVGNFVAGAAAPDGGRGGHLGCRTRRVSDEPTRRCGGNGTTGSGSTTDLSQRRHGGRCRRRRTS